MWWHDCSSSIMLLVLLHHHHHVFFTSCHSSPSTRSNCFCFFVISLALLFYSLGSVSSASPWASSLFLPSVVSAVWSSQNDTCTFNHNTLNHALAYHYISDAIFPSSPITPPNWYWPVLTFMAPNVVVARDVTSQWILVIVHCHHILLHPAN